MGSTGRKIDQGRGAAFSVRRLVCMLLAVCLVAGLNPASALAAGGAGVYGTGVGATAGAGAGQGTTASTDVNVAVRSSFAVRVDNTEAIVVADARKLESGEYQVRGSVSEGQPLRDAAGSYYEYKWVREVWVAGEGADGGAWQDDAGYNAAHSAWQRADVPADAGTGAVQVPALNLNDVRDTLDFAGQARYRYSLVAKDRVLERTSDNSVEVVCSAHYAFAEVSTPLGVGELYARGLLHVGDPQLYMTELGPGSAAYQQFLRTAEGRAIDSAFDMTITEQQAANHGEPAYLQPLDSIDIPVSDAVPAGAAVSVYTVADGRIVVMTDCTTTTESDGTRYVRVKSGAYIGDAAAALVCGAFAVAYAPAADEPAVNVTSQVAGEGGLIDILGTYAFAQGTTVRYTFLPTAGYCLDRVEVVEGDPAQPTSTRTYYAGSSYPNFGANWLDYTVAPANPAHPDDVTITAHFAPAHVEDPGAAYTVTASVGSGEGAVQIVGGSGIPGAQGAQLITVKAGSAVTIRFIPGQTSVLDYVEVTTGTGEGAIVERPQVMGDALTLPAVTANMSVVAHFKEGTPVVYPDAHIGYTPTEGGEFGDGSPTSAPYGSAVTVQVVPDAGFRTEAVWFVLASDPNGPKYPLRYSGSGTSWIIDQVVGDILVSASFASTAMQVRVEAEAGGSVRASYVDAAGSAVGALDVSAGAPSGGIIADLASDSDVQLTVVPDAGKLAQVSVVAKDGTKTVVPIVGTAASVTNSMLTDPQFSHIAVEFRDMVPETLSVGLSMPDLGVKVLRTDVGGAGEIAPGTTKIDDIDSEDGLSLRVELLDGYKDLVVDVVDATGAVIHTATVGADGAVRIAPEFLGAANTVRITCTPEAPAPPEHDAIEVIATTDGNGTITTDDKTSFAADEELTDIAYEIGAHEGYALDHIALSGSGAGVEPRTFAGTAAGDGWTFTLTAALIGAGYDRVHAVFKAAPQPGVQYWVEPVVVDAAGQPVSGEAAHGTVSPAERFQVTAGGMATFTFVPEAGYVAEVAVDSTAGPWTKAPTGSFTVGMGGGITADTTVYVRFVENGDTPQPTYHTIQASVYNDKGGSISPAGTLPVPDGATQAFSFAADTGWQLLYVLVDAGTPNEATYPAESLASTNGQFILTDITADHTVQAVFGEDGAVEDVVVWQVSGGEHGTVSPAGSVQVLVSEGGRDVQITPDEGYVIDTVYIDGKPIVLATHPAFTGTSFGGTFRLPAVAGGGGTFHVTFAPRPAEVALHVNVNGTGGKASPPGDSVAHLGAQQTVTFAPDAGFRLEYARFVNEKGEVLANGDFTQAAIAGGLSYTFTVKGETWIECAFVEDGGEVPPGPDDTITITAVSVGAGKINPYGEQTLRPGQENSKITFTLTPDAGAKLVQLTVGGRDVTAEVRDGRYTLLAKDAHDGDEVRAVFEKNPVVRGKIELTSGPGGKISPAGTVEPAVGTTLPVSFLPEAGMVTESVQLTYMNADGSTWTKTIKGSMNYYNVAVTADLVGVHVTFKEAGPNVPVVRTATVKASFAPGSQDMGGISPTAGTVVSVVQGGSALFNFQPKPGYRVKSATLNGGANLVQVGATHLYVRYAELLRVGADKATADLEVTFEKIPANPDYVNIIVDVNTSVESGQRSGIEVGAGGTVSPKNIRVPFGSSEVYQFYVFPDEGYKLASITASVDGGAPVDLDYSTNSHQGAVNDVSAILAGSGAVHGPGGGADGGDAGAPATGGARYYLFQLQNITGNVNVKVDFITYADAEEDDAINGGGKRVQLTVGSSEGGFISPSGTMTLPEGCTYPFLIEPDSAAWEPVAVVITYADGTKKIIEDVEPGRMPITITGDMTSIYVSFEQVGTPVEMIDVTASSTGPGSISPAGSFQVKKGETQGFTFKFDTKYTYIKSLIVERADGSRQDLAADGWIWKFDTSYYEYGIDSALRVSVEFAEGDEENPMWEETRYVKVVAGTTTEGAAGGAGGTIEPAGEMWMVAGTGSQLFCFKPKRGYVVDSVSIVEGSGADAKVRMLSAEEIANREVLLNGIDADTTIMANFVAAFYYVDITSTDGGKFNVEGTGIGVRQGQRLGLYAQAESAHELASISTGGLVVHDKEAVDDEGQIDRVESLGGSAGATGELHTFAVAGSGSVHGVFRAAMSGPDDPNKPGTPAEKCTVKVSSSGHGEVNPAGTMSIAKGSTLTLELKPALGYFPASVTLKNAQGQTDIANAARTFTMKVQEDCELVANFSAVAAPGTSNPVNRAVHTLQSLAQTGDNAMVGMLALAALACAGAGLMLVTRRRKQDEE